MEEQKRTGGVSRRHFLTIGTTIAGGCGFAASFLADSLMGRGKAHGQGDPDCGMTLPLPLPGYIDSEKVRKYAWEHYFDKPGGCMHGTATGLIHAFMEELPGSDWEKLPFGMYLYGAGGIGKWGTICGCLNGAMAVLNLAGLHSVLADPLFQWYVSANFPLDNLDYYVPDGDLNIPAPIPDRDVLAHTVADSPLCHLSISKWCRAAGVSLANKDDQSRNLKDDRCGKIAADTAAKTAELINDLFAEKLSAPWIPEESYAECIQCHTGERKDTVTRMSCGGCHNPEENVTVGNRHPSTKNGR